MFNLKQWQVQAIKKLELILNSGVVVDYVAELDKELEKLNGLSITSEDQAREMINAVATLSHCKKRKVAFLILRDNKIISVGVNHNPSDFSCELDTDSNVTKESTVHAEMHALSKLGDAKNTVMVGSYEPCVHCAEPIHSSGVVNVLSIDVGLSDNPTNYGFKVLSRLGVTCGTFAQSLL